METDEVTSIISASLVELMHVTLSVSAFIWQYDSLHITIPNYGCQENICDIYRQPTPREPVIPLCLKKPAD